MAEGVQTDAVALPTCEGDMILQGSECVCPVSMVEDANAPGSCVCPSEFPVARSDGICVTALDCSAIAGTEANGMQTACVCAEAEERIFTRTDSSGTVTRRCGLPLSGLTELAELGADPCAGFFGEVHSDANGEGIVCSDVDRQDTFCLLGSAAEAFQCRGLFNHVWECNKSYNRPALSVFLCAPECGAGEESRGAHCYREEGVQFPPLAEEPEAAAEEVVELPPEVVEDDGSAGEEVASSGS